MEQQKAQKRGRGRPPKPAPEPIPDTAENVTALVLKTRPKQERDRLMGRE